MAKGVPKHGLRMTKGRLEHLARLGIPPEDATPEMFKPLIVQFKQPDPIDYVPETDEEIHNRINERFEIIGELVQSCIEGNIRSLIISGPPGLSKSFTVEKLLQEWNPDEDQYSINKGLVKPTGLYRLLYEHRDEGQVLVLDDADSVFDDINSINILKAACDTTKTRVVSYLVEMKMQDEDGEPLPRRFEFNGTVIFLTNESFEGSEHLQALVSRSHYIDCAMRTTRDYIIRIKQVVNQGMLVKRGLTKTQSDEVVEFICDNQNRLTETSLRIALKIGDLVKAHPQRWRSMALVTCCRNVY